MNTPHRINPRYRAFGKARIDIARRVKNQADWDALWKEPAQPFPFAWDNSWKHCIEYKVNDFAAEIGFFIDVLGLPVTAFGPDYAQFTSPQGEFYFAVTSAPGDEAPTPPDALRIQFTVTNLLATVAQLEKRGITFEQKPRPSTPGSSLYTGFFRTPHGICIDLWGMVDLEEPNFEVPVSPATDPDSALDSQAEGDPAHEDE
jgi:catechol 2,3-dioxygenase-like lactoylglutathione lyase family enzyme